MKQLKILMSAVLVVVLFACNNKVKDAEVDSIAPEKNESGYELKETDENALTVENPPLNMEREKAEMMYKDLNMTKDQIYSFETQYKERVEEAENKNNELNTEINRDQLMHDAMKEVLSKEQLVEFERWQKANI